jgi:hypothetical protein
VPRCLLWGSLLLVRACCVVVLTTLLLAAVPTAALAGGVEVVPSTSATEVEVPVGRPIKAPMAFGFVAFSGVPDGALVAFRTAGEDGRWNDWLEEDEEPEEGITEGGWVGESRWLEARVPGEDVATLTAHLIDTTALSHGVVQRTLDAVRSAWRGQHAVAAEAPSLDAPRVMSRLQWGAEPLGADAPRRQPRYESTINAAVVHHTGMSNDYQPWEAPGVVRAVHYMHSHLRGWGDIGYNALVDRYGVVYEGRAGGLSQAVMGAHAGGFNRGTFGISIMGEFDKVLPPVEALEAVSQMIAWKFRLHGVDPAGTTVLESTGSSIYPSGTRVRLPTIIGHRNVSITVCPGDALYAHLPHIRHRVYQLVGDSAAVSLSGHAEGIGKLLQAGITQGCDEERFCPADPLSRGQAATMVARAFDLEPDSGDDQFTDIAESSHRGAINALAAAGVFGGCDDERFCPNTTITRGQFATALARSAGLDGIEEGTGLFDDIPGSPHAPAIRALAEAGAVSGCQDRKFCPGQALTRAQAATMLARVLDL